MKESSSATMSVLSNCRADNSVKQSVKLLPAFEDKQFQVAYVYS